MKALCTFVLSLFLMGQCLAGNTLVSLTGAGQSGPPAAGCSQATTFLARTSGLSGTETTAYTNLICGLVTDGTFSLLDALYIFATNTTTTAALNLISTNFSLVTHGTLTFAADSGYTGNGSTGYLDTQFTPSTAGGHYTQNSASIGIYDLTSGTGVGSSAVAMGTSTASGSAYVYITPVVSSGSPGLALDVNGATFGALGSATNQQGLWIATRTSSTTINGYRNGASVAAPETDTSTAFPNTSMIIFAFTDSGTVDKWTTDKLSAAFIGGSLTSGQAGTISTRINAYMTAFGINVY